MSSLGLTMRELDHPSNEYIEQNVLDRPIETATASDGPVILIDDVRSPKVILTPSLDPPCEHCRAIRDDPTHLTVVQPPRKKRTLDEDRPLELQRQRKRGRDDCAQATWRALSLDLSTALDAPSLWHPFAAPLCL